MSRWTLVIIATMLAAGCTPDGGTTSATLDLDGLPELEQGAYALWYDLDGVATLAGTFTEPGGATFELDESLSTSELLEVSVEDDADAPTGDSVVLSGTLADGLAFPFDVSTVSGGISLWSPTDGVDDNPEVGAWWFVDDGSGAAPSLSIPTLPAGWSFATWGDTQGTTLPMGSFTDGAAADSACLFCGADPDEGSVPGEDFVANLPASITGPVNLADGASSVTLSLQPDIWEITAVDSPMFGLDVLSSDVPLDQAGGEMFELDSVFDAPSGVVTE